MASIVDVMYAAMNQRKPEYICGRLMLIASELNQVYCYRSPFVFVKLIDYGRKILVFHVTPNVLAPRVRSLEQALNQNR